MNNSGSKIHHIQLKWESATSAFNPDFAEYTAYSLYLFISAKNLFTAVPSVLYIIINCISYHKSAFSSMNEPPSPSEINFQNILSSTNIILSLPTLQIPTRTGQRFGYLQPRPYEIIFLTYKNILKIDFRC